MPLNVIFILKIKIGTSTLHRENTNKFRPIEILNIFKTVERRQIPILKLSFQVNVKASSAIIILILSNLENIHKLFICAPNYKT